MRKNMPRAAKHQFRPTLIALALAAFLGSGIAHAAGDEFSRIAEAANRYAAEGKPILVTAERLNALLTDTDPSNDPFLVSVCAPDDYAKARISGSINIPRGAFWKPHQLAKLPPKDKLIVTYCYTGTGAVGPAAVLNLMGYSAVQLEWGTMGWSKNDAVLGPATRFPESQEEYPVDKTPVVQAFTWSFPVVATGKAELADVLVARGDAVEAADRSVSMIAEAVQGLLTDANPANDPFVVDARVPEDYAKGHIKGAVNIPAAALYQPANLAKLPPGRRIVVADYNGQQAVGMSYVLSILGYNARGLQFGMMGWSKDNAPMGPYKRFPADQKDYPIASGK